MNIKCLFKLLNKWIDESLPTYSAQKTVGEAWKGWDEEDWQSRKEHTNTPKRSAMIYATLMVEP